MGLKSLEVRAFTLRDAINHRDLPRMELERVCAGLDMPMAKHIGTGESSRTADQLRELAQIKYANGKHGEGIVVRSINSLWSFKVLNLDYKA